MTSKKHKCRHRHPFPIAIAARDMLSVANHTSNIEFLECLPAIPPPVAPITIHCHQYRHAMRRPLQTHDRNAPAPTMILRNHRRLEAVATRLSNWEPIQRDNPNENGMRQTKRKSRQAKRTASQRGGFLPLLLRWPPRPLSDLCMAEGCQRRYRQRQLAAIH